MEAPALHTDTMRGAAEISTFLYGSPKHKRKVYHLKRAKKNNPPMFFMGSTLCARKSEILKWIAEQETRP